ncbi:MULTISPECIES: molecular chaperone [unclassified Massilia]|uniref:TorD/DmsD family molecular chaperone n=1 Tax=unclassified Massilia TaxID=2609279 RepID=UPI001E634BC8|nr:MULTISPECIES: molecular chaperone TorD family protein [unclassified Massilia]
MSDEDQARADFYALIARLMLAPPNAGLLAALAEAEPLDADGIDEDGRALQEAWLKLTQAASVMDAGALAEEFDALFISTGDPLLNPYGSVYLAGHLNDFPLAELRQDLARLRIARARGVGEFEDHLSALCETMRVLITGAPGIARQPLAEQKRLFVAHIQPWYAACLRDVAAAGPANFYKVVAAFAGAFLAVEAHAFAVWEPADAPLAA